MAQITTTFARRPGSEVFLHFPEEMPMTHDLTKGSRDYFLTRQQATNLYLELNYYLTETRGEYK